MIIRELDSFSRVVSSTSPLPPPWMMEAGNTHKKTASQFSFVERDRQCIRKYFAILGREGGREKLQSRFFFTYVYHLNSKTTLPGEFFYRVKKENFYGPIPKVVALYGRS